MKVDYINFNNRRFLLVECQPTWNLDNFKIQKENSIFIFDVGKNSIIEFNTPLDIENDKTVELIGKFSAFKDDVANKIVERENGKYINYISKKPQLNSAVDSLYTLFVSNGIRFTYLDYEDNTKNFWNDLILFEIK